MALDLVVVLEVDVGALAEEIELNNQVLFRWHFWQVHSKWQPTYKVRLHFYSLL